MSGLARLWREPLVHFLLLGAALFAAFGVMQERGDEGPDRIVVDASQVQQLAARFKRTWLRAPTQEELVGLVEGYVREEVYYREALAMGLDRNDPVVRNRMRVKLEFLLEELGAEGAPGDEALAAYLREHADAFRLPARVSFRHVYLSPDRRDDLAGDAGRVLARLNVGAAPAALGDRPLVPEEYVLATPAEIGRVFGDAFAQELGAIEPGAWAGPVYSGLGGHVVKVSERKEGRPPALAEVRAQVEREYLARRRTQLKESAYRRLREAYEVVVAPAVPAAITAGPALAAYRPGAQGR